MTVNPYLSVVIPVFNREKEIRRAVESCLSQDFQDFEVLVVDDGSSDRSPEIVDSIRDLRVCLLRHAANRGVCPARNTGVRAAVGEWIVLLDSDDELLPGALHRMADLAHTLPMSVHRMAFMYRRDDGQLSPDPAPRQGIVNYLGWLDFSERARLPDELLVTRRNTFQNDLFPDSRVAEVSYQLEFASKYSTMFVPEALGFVHTDSSDRLSSVTGDATWAERRQRSHDRAVDLEQVLERHGASLRQFAPTAHRKVCSALVVHQVIGGMRLRAVLSSVRNLLSFPRAPRNWAALVLALIGARATHYLRSHKVMRDQRRNSAARREARA